MPSNRLRLDFSLQTTEERLRFLESYLPTLTFIPNEHESETLSDYILWGKNPETGLNAQQEGNIILKEWAPNTNVESLEGLMEIPGFQEARLRNIGGPHYRTKRIVFNRDEALRKATPYIKSILQDLFEEIDRTELTINYYELKTGKRQNPPRESLLKRFSAVEREELEEKAAHINARKYLQLRHHLVELRTEQYTYRDSIQTTIMPHSEVHIESDSDNIRIDEDIEVRPFGIHDNSVLSQKIFRWPPAPQLFTETELKRVSEYIWREPDKTKPVINFEDPAHILTLYKHYHELITEGDEDPHQIYGSAAAIIRTLQFYESMARLTDLQRELLHMKIDHKTNSEIREYINSKYGTAYNENYISTIYRQKILPTIAQAAAFHKLTMENIFYPEAFKTCKDCGSLLLRAPEFFMRQAKSRDGFSPRCKICQKKLLERRKKNATIKYIKLNDDDNRNAAT